MSVSPESQSVPIEPQNKRWCSKFRRFELLKLIGGGLLSLSIVGLVISNTVLIHSSIIPSDVGELQREINNLKAAFEAQQAEIKSLQVKNEYQQEELSDFRVQVKKAAVELKEYRQDTDESFSTVHQNLTEIGTHVEILEVELNQTQVDLENTTVEFSQYRLNTDETFSAVYQNIDEIDMNIENIEVEINQTQIEFENEKAYMTRELDLVKVDVGLILYNSSCEEISTYSVKKTGYYLIQPSLDLAAFPVLCDFQNGEVLTILEHKQTQERIYHRKISKY